MAGHGKKNMPMQKPKNTGKTVKRLFAYLTEFKIQLFLVFCCIVVSAGAGILGNYMLKPALNDFIIPLIGSKNPNFAPFIAMLCKMFVIFMFGAVATYANSRLMLNISTKILYKIRVQLFTKMEKLPLKYFDTHSHGDIMSRYTNDTDTLRDMLSQALPQMFSSVLTIVASFVMMLVLNPILTLVVILCIVFMVFCVGFIGKHSAKAFREQQAAIGAVNGFIEELIEGQNVVKVFCREQNAKKDFDALNEKLCKAGTRANSLANILPPMMNNMGHISYALVAIVGVLLVIANKSNLGTIAAFLQYSKNFTQPVTQMAQLFNGILNSLAGAERIFSIIDEKEEIDDGYVSLVYANVLSDGTITESFLPTSEWAWKHPHHDGTITYTLLKGEIEFENVTFGYTEKKCVLHNINLLAKPGQKIALVGSTGSGKTTITNLINRFYELSQNENVEKLGDGGNIGEKIGAGENIIEGECEKAKQNIENFGGKIRFDGINITKIKKEDLRRSLSMVLQDTHLFTGTIADNIRFGKLDASMAEVEQAAILANADYFIRHLSNGYQTVISGDGSNLSQGQRQLLAIARAAIANPPVLILDEATSSIDTRTEVLIEKGMDSLMHGRTVFVIAHRLSTVRNADMILVLEDGKIIESGNHNQLIDQKGKYYKLYTGLK